jgi:predicted dehydrogenase
MLREARALLDRGIPVLCETPAATSEEQLSEQLSLIPPDARLQVAEQFLCQPELAAARALVASGLLGKVHYARISVAHGYHAASIARGILGLGDAMPDEVHALTLPDPIRRTRGRPGDVPPEDAVARQNLAILRFGDKTVQIDFAREQYFSPIRTGSLLLRGTHGEFCDGTLRYLDKNNRAVTLPLIRTDYGKGSNLDGFAHARILAGEHTLYENPFPLARLSDEETAIATVLQNMTTYLQTGKSFYSLDEARQDCRLSFLIEK